MSRREHREPDPTLSTPTLMADGDGGVYATHDDRTHCSIVWPDGEHAPAVACVATPTHFLGHHHLRHWTVMPLRDAAYVALPCRECFPEAPPPGTLQWCCGSDECGRGVPSYGLAWQLAGSDVRPASHT